MRLFGRHRGNSTPVVEDSVPGLAERDAAHRWQRIAGRPFDGHLEDAVHDITRALYGVPRGSGTWTMEATVIASTVFSDVFRGEVDGRAVTVANGWTDIHPEQRHAKPDMKGVAVCAVEMPSMLLLQCVQPRQYPAVAPVRETPTGQPDFDQRFRVTGAPDAVQQALTPELQRLIMAREDWVFWAERYLLACVSKGAFREVEDVTQRVDALMEIVAAIPISVMPAQVDHSQDDLLARIGALKSVEEAMAMLQALTPQEREQLARSETPLAALADVRTPQEAMARFRGMNQEQKLQLFAMFSNVRDARRG